MKKYTSYVYLVIAALIYHLGHPNHLKFIFPLGPIIGTSVLIYFLFKAHSFFTRVKYLLTFNFIITLFSFYWITATLQEFGNLPKLVAMIANSMYSLMFQPHYWLIIILLSLIEKKAVSLKRHYFTHPLFALILAIIITTFEYFFPQQFPVLLGQPWIVFSSSLFFASIFGLPIYSFFSYLLSIELIQVFKYRRKNTFNWVIIFSFILLNPLLSGRQKDSSKTEFESLNIRLVQANISNFLKVASEQGTYASVSQVLDQYKELSLKEPKNGEKIDLIIWPETAYPYAIETDKENIKKTLLPPIITEIIKQSKSELVTGGYDEKSESEDYFMTDYNTAFHINASGETLMTYNKQVLIPFGETLPFGPLNRFASELFPAVAFFAQGETYPNFKIKGRYNFIPTICYELLRPEFIRDYLNNISVTPQYILNLTNDSWYGNTLEPEQHLFLTKWRALEFNLPIIRSTNTGISTVISNKGEELARLNYGIKGNLDLKIQINTDKTRTPSLFQQYGFVLNLPIWFLCFIFQLFLLKLNYVKNN